MLNFKKVTGAEINDQDIADIKKNTSSNSGGNQLKEPGEYKVQLIEKRLPKANPDRKPKDANWQSIGLVYKVIEGPQAGKTIRENCMVPVGGTTRHVSDSERWTALGKYLSQMKGFGFSLPDLKLDGSAEEQAQAKANYKASLTEFINTSLTEMFGSEKAMIGTELTIVAKYQGFHAYYKEVESGGKKDMGMVLFDNKGVEVESFMKRVKADIAKSGKNPFKRSEDVEKFMLEKKINIHETTRQPKVNFNLDVAFRKAIVKEEVKQETAATPAPAPAPEATPAPAPVQEEVSDKEPWEL